MPPETMKYTRTLRRTLFARAGALALIAGVGAVSLTACVPQEEIPGYPGEPTRSGEPLRVETDGDWDVRAGVSGHLLIVTTTGSGSCPFIPQLEQIDDAAEQVLLMTSTSKPGGPCTANVAPHTVELDMGRDVSGYTVHITPP